MGADDEAAQQVSILYLPEEVMQAVFSLLNANELARAQCVCKLWKDAGEQPELWRRLHDERWRHASLNQWEELRSQGLWYKIFCERAKIDAQAKLYLHQLQWPQRWYDGVQSLDHLGFDNFKDLLIEHVTSETGGCGAKYRASVAAEDVAGRQAAADIRRLISDHNGKHLDEGALLVAAIHRPLADLDWVRSALDSLGRELSRRLEQQGISGGILALQVLTHLLFGPMPPPSHPGFSAIPPPPGYGMGLQGNRESYYDPENSLISEVLVNREGIPISLAVIHASVGCRAGLEVRLLNVPMHVVTHYGEEGSDEERFVDVFDQGRIMTRAEMGDLLGGLGLLGFDRRHLQPLPPPRVYARMCYNLASIYSALGSSGDVDALKVQKSVMRLLVALDPSDSFSSRMELAKACAALQQYEEALEILMGMSREGSAMPGTPTTGRHLLEGYIARLRGAVQERDEELGRRYEREGNSMDVRYRVGQVIRHRRYEYRGVIVGWDPHCTASEDWVRQMGVDRLERGRQQPFYHVLVDPQDRGGQQTYVAQENIALEALPRRLRKPGFEVHPEVGRYFEELQADGAAYVLNQWMRERYPGC